MNPISDDDRMRLQAQLVEVLNQMSAIAESPLDQSEKRAALLRLLSQFNAWAVAEKEIIGDVFMEIGELMGMDIGLELSRWAYGIDLEDHHERSPIGLEAQNEVACSGCGTGLKVVVLEMEDGIPDHWLIAKCNSCGAKNLLSTGPNALEIRYIGFNRIRILEKEKFSLATALDFLK